MKSAVRAPAQSTGAFFIRGQSTFSINGSEYNNTLAAACLIDFCAANGGPGLASRIVHKKVL
jgi:hypothetical protein